MKSKLINKKELKEIMEHFKNEICDLEDEYYSKGEEQGFIWAKSAPIENVHCAKDWYPGFEIDADFLVDIVNEAINSDVLMGFKDKNNSFNTIADSYFQGWDSAVSSFWDEIEDNYYTMGEENGFKWAISASYKELTFAIRWDPYTQPTHDFLEKVVIETIKNDALMKLGNDQNESYISPAFHFFRGWVTGAVTLWEMIE